MTLIVALACTDGAIIGSDSSATFVAEGVRYPTTKIHQLGESLLWAASGHEGLHQQIKAAFDAEFEKTHPMTVAGWSAEELQVKLQQLAQPIMARAAAMHVRGLPPPYNEPPIAHILAVTCCGPSPAIIEIEPNAATGRLEAYGCAAIGSGAPYAHALLLRFRHKAIQKDIGQVVVYRAIEEAVEVAAYGLGPPVKVWAVEPADGKRKIPRITDLNGKEDEERIKYALNLWRGTEDDDLSTIIGSKPAPEEKV